MFKKILAHSVSDEVMQFALFSCLSLKDHLGLCSINCHTHSINVNSFMSEGVFANSLRMISAMTGNPPKDCTYCKIILTCRKWRWICRRHSINVSRQAVTSSKSRPYHDYYRRGHYTHTFSLTVCEVLRHATWIPHTWNAW